MRVRHSLMELSKLLILQRVSREMGWGRGDCVSYRDNGVFTSYLKGDLCWIKKHTCVWLQKPRNWSWLTSALDPTSSLDWLHCWLADFQCMRLSLIGWFSKVNSQKQTVIDQLDRIKNSSGVFLLSCQHFLRRMRTKTFSYLNNVPVIVNFGVAGIC